MKIPDLGVWEAFFRVATDGSFVKAAREMQISPPLLTRRIAQLEEALGARLFHRSTRKVSLTADGQGLLPVVAPLLEDFRGLEDRFSSQGQIQGLIRMTCLPALAHRVLAPLLAEFRALHPKVRFEIDLTDRVVDLIDSRIDLAIRIDEPEDSELVYKRLGANRLFACASPAYLRATRSPLKTPSDLRHHPVLGHNVHEWCRFKGTSLKLGDLRGNSWISSDSGHFLTEMALQGGGIVIRSQWDVGDLLERGELVQVLKKFPIEDFGEIYAVIPSRRYLARRIRTFIDFVAERVSAAYG